MSEKPLTPANDITVVRRKQIVDALRRGTVPRHGLEGRA